MQKLGKNKNEIAAGTMLSYLSLGIGYLISIMYTPVMLNILGQSEYGLYSLASSTASYLGLLSFGFGASYVRFYFRETSRGKEFVARLNGMYLLIFSAIGLLALIAGGILIAGLPDIFQAALSASEIAKTQRLMVILVINMAISFPASLFSSYITANEKFIFQKGMQIINNVLNPFLTLPLLLLGYASTGLVVASLILNIVISLCNIVYCIKKLHMRLSFRRMDRGLFRSMTIFSGYIFINIIVDQVSWNVDKFILGICQGTAAVAIYGIGAQINGYYRSFSTAVSNQYIPEINRIVSSSDDNGQLLKLMQRVGRVQFMVLMPICTIFLLYGKVFIRLWAGSDYGESYLVMIILMVPSTVPLIQNLGIEIQRAKNMHQFRSVVYLLIAVINVLISIPLGIRFGPAGCAAGTALSLLFGNGILMNWYYHSRCGIDMRLFWNSILKLLPAGLISGAAGVLAGAFLLKDNLVRLALCTALYLTVYVRMIYVIGMNAEEKGFLQRLLVRLCRRNHGT